MKEHSPSVAPPVLSTSAVVIYTSECSASSPGTIFERSTSSTVRVIKVICFGEEFEWLFLLYSMFKVGYSKSTESYRVNINILTLVYEFN
jgi:hypothetical protein